MLTSPQRRTRQEIHDRRQAAISEIARHRVEKTQGYLKDAGADIYGEYVFDEGAQRDYLAKPIFRSSVRRSRATSRSIRPSWTPSRTA